MYCVLHAAMSGTNLRQIWLLHRYLHPPNSPKLIRGQVCLGPQGVTIPCLYKVLKVCL